MTRWKILKEGVRKYKSKNADEFANIIIPFINKHIKSLIDRMPFRICKVIKNNGVIMYKF
jgi:hypothetical protein